MGWLRRTLGWVLALALLLALAAVGVLALALQDAPEVTRTPEVALADLTRAARLLSIIDPRRQGGAGPRQFALTQRELELLLDQLSQRTVPAATRLTLQARSARLQLSLQPRGVNLGALTGRWLNIDAVFAETGAAPVLDGLRVGSLPVPAWLGTMLLQSQLERYLGPEQSRTVRDMVQAVTFAPNRMTVSYVWKPGTTRRLLAALVPRADQDRLRVYVERLAGLKLKSVAAGRIPMVQLLPPAFALARQRTAAGGDAAQENRAAIVALAFASFPRELVSVVPAARRWRLPPPWRLSLVGRDDYPLHYLISAALAVEAGGPLADAVGLFKEVLDARGTSGFSFNDLAADRAGTRLGLAAVRAPERLQQTLAAGVGDADLMPDVVGLPESLSAAEFSQRFGQVGSPAYQRLIADIESRLDKLPLYR